MTAQPAPDVGELRDLGELARAVSRLKGPCHHRLETTSRAAAPARPPLRGELEFARASSPVTWDEVDQTTGQLDES